MDIAFDFEPEEVVKPYSYHESPEFKEFLSKITQMDRATLENELEFVGKMIFFTDRAASRETPGGDQSMHKQLERLNIQRILMEKILQTLPKPKVKRAPKRKKRR